MKMNPLPPQAYTKDTLAHAFDWLQAQPESIREMATTPDMLVGLYLKAKFQGSDSLERPSIQNFKTELKSLAGMMGEFSTQLEIRPEPRSEHRPEHKHESRQEHRPEHRPEIRQEPKQDSRAHSRSEPSAADTANLRPEAKPVPRTTSHSLDSRSVQMIHEVKTQFNVGSDAEALRLLIAVGYQRMKGLL